MCWTQGKGRSAARSFQTKVWYLACGAGTKGD